MKGSVLTVWVILAVFASTSATHYTRYQAHRSPEGHDDFDFHDELLPSVPRSTAAHLLVDKQILNNVLIESMDVIVKYTIYNVGFRQANDVHLWDAEFDDTNQFRIVGGMIDVFLGSIPPGSNVSHTIVVRPLISGPFEFKAGRVDYISDEGKTTFGSTSETGNITILSTPAYRRQFSVHFEEWVVFTILSLPSLVIPYMLWLNNKSLYENIMKDSSGPLKKKKMYCYRDR